MYVHVRVADYWSSSDVFQCRKVDCIAHDLCQLNCMYMYMYLASKNRDLANRAGYWSQCPSDGQ